MKFIFALQCGSYPPLSLNTGSLQKELNPVFKRSLCDCEWCLAFKLTQDLYSDLHLPGVFQKHESG